MTVSVVGIDEALHVFWVVLAIPNINRSIYRSYRHTNSSSVIDTVSFTYFKKIYFLQIQKDLSVQCFSAISLCSKQEIHQLQCTIAGDGTHVWLMIGFRSSIFKTWSQILGSYLGIFNAACVCETYWGQKRRQKVFHTSQGGRQLQLTALAMQIQGGNPAFSDWSKVFIAIEEESTELQILCQFETTSLPNCLERQPNKKQLNNKSAVRTTVEVKTKRRQKKHGDRNWVLAKLREDECCYFTYITMSWYKDGWKLSKFPF